MQRGGGRGGRPEEGRTRPGMDYRRSEISKRDLECQQGAEGTGLRAWKSFNSSPAKMTAKVHRRTRRVLSSSSVAYDRPLAENFYLPADDLCMSRAKLFCQHLAELASLKRSFSQLWSSERRSRRLVGAICWNRTHKTIIKRIARNGIRTILRRDGILARDS